MLGLDRPWVFATGLSYLLLLSLIGLWAARRTKNAKDFFVAGQRIGLVVTALATMTASFSGFLFLGGPGLTYRIGAASFFICSSVSFTSALLCWTVAKRLRLLAEVREVFTISDALWYRFGSRTVSGVAAAAIALGAVAYLGLQLRVLAVVFESIFASTPSGDGSQSAAMFAGAAVLLAYSVAGGMVAGVYTDLLQGILMLTAAVAVFFKAITAGGGLSRIAASLSDFGPHGDSFLDPIGTLPVLGGLGFFFVFSIGTLGQPHLVHKFFMLDDPRKLKWMPLTLAGSQTLCVLIWIGVGLAVPALVAQGRLAPLAQPDDAAPAFLANFAPDWLTGLVFAGILAAVMSTADSLINIGSAALARDIPRAFGRPISRELRWGRIAAAVVMLAAFALARSYGDLIALLGTFAFGAFAAALAPVLAIGLNWRRVTAKAATASIVAGTGFNLAFEFLNRAGYSPFAPGVLPAAAAMAASFTILFCVTWITRPQTIDPDIELVLDI